MESFKNYWMKVSYMLRGVVDLELKYVNVVNVKKDETDSSRMA
jgi:hypothetical protein